MFAYTVLSWFLASLYILMYFEVLLGWGGYPQHPRRHPVPPGVVLSRLLDVFLWPEVAFWSPGGPTLGIFWQEWGQNCHLWGAKVVAWDPYAFLVPPGVKK